MTMTIIQPTTLLRYALLGDAVASGATGLLMAAGAPFLSGLLGLPEGLLRGAGILLLPFAAAVAFLGTRPMLRHAMVWAVIALNILWTVASIALLASGWVQPAALGYAFVIFQALVVLAFADLQFIGLRRAPRPASVLG
jgi:hypothetical protein